MKKYLLLIVPLVVICVVCSPHASAQSCQRCGTGAYCTSGYFGGCGCEQVYLNGYRVCATCGFCAPGTCLYPCFSSVQAMNPKAAGAPLRPLSQVAWVNSTAVVGRVKLQSPEMSGLLGALQQRFKAKGSCDSLRGRIVSDNGTPGADWEAVIAHNGAQVSLHSDMGREEILAVDDTSWTLRRDRAVVISEKLDLAGK